jgi:hypothetical protein
MSEAQPGQTEEGRIESLDTRFGAIETEQREQRGMLDKILTAVSGTGGQAAATAHRADTTVVDDRLDRPSRIQDQMKEAIRAVNAEQQQAQQPGPAAPAAEAAPAEVAIRGKQRLQQIVFGKDPA